MKSNTYSTDDDKFLQRLSGIAKPPKLVHVIGKLPDNHRPCIAIVGSRKPTSYGKEVTFKLAYELAKRGVVIISGLAYGVDAIAHKAALEAGGTTIAVLAHGLDTIYPASHSALARQIVEQGGALISEYPEKTPALQYRFLERNRLVSGLSDGVVITEAARRSGTLATIMHALEQSKEVFAVPGNITSPLSAGPNKIITEGAHPTLSYHDILFEIAPDLLHDNSPKVSAPDHPTLKLLYTTPKTTDELASALGQTASETLSQLSILELEGSVRKNDDEYWQFTPP